MDVFLFGVTVSWCRDLHGAGHGVYASPSFPGIRARAGISDSRQFSEHMHLAVVNHSTFGV